MNWSEAHELAIEFAEEAERSARAAGATYEVQALATLSLAYSAIAEAKRDRLVR